MFQFTAFALHDLWIQSWVTQKGRVSPFGHLGINANLPAPPSFSQAITSFVAYHRQGIHHVLLFTWPYNFDVSPDYSSKTQNRLKEYVRSFTWRVMPYSSFTLILLNFKLGLNIRFDAIKNSCCWWHGACFHAFHQQRWFDSMNF